MFGPRNKAADVAVLLEEGLRNGRIVVSPSEDYERAELGLSEMALAAIGFAFAFIIAVPAVLLNYHRLAEMISKVFERLR
jgi:hypothetical protein